MPCQTTPPCPCACRGEGPAVPPEVQAAAPPTHPPAHPASPHHPFSREPPAPTRCTRCTALWTPGPPPPPWEPPFCGGSDDPQTAAEVSPALSRHQGHLRLASHTRSPRSLRWLPLCRAVVRRSSAHVSPAGLGTPAPVLTGVLHVARDCHLHLEVLTGCVLQVQDIVGAKDLAQSERGREHRTQTAQT